MPRANLKKAKALITDAVDQSITRLLQEREIDSAHIEQHAEASQAQLDRLANEEARLLAALEQNRTAMNAAMEGTMREVKSLFADMRATEGERLRSLRAHADDINDDGEGILEEPSPRKRIASK